ncbi:lysozyme inhibitor LprI family protein [Kozakia baliensis]|uniref:Lysozyme inhibitor LprI-like N-terminal domain-containing protein n=1 Tax=Kozakia baliensis TaxID=153496 RepID=A0A1D8UQR1_9PROT|nr:lysozyme inhibitor LprI family protein [Kozakia baliensis]AOX15992.1 hypothetical protein A0U89_01295 [Kozakia baliensis]
MTGTNIIRESTPRMKTSLLFLIGTLTTGLPHAALAAPASCEQAQTTVQMEDCRAEDTRNAEKELQRYTQAAIKRIRHAGLPPQTLASFQKAMSAWAQYRRAECVAIYDKWSDGTIRGMKAQECLIHLTKTRTHEIWRNWLTFMDSKPSILPEPQEETAKP